MVDDDEAIRDLFHAVLSDEGYGVRAFAGPADYPTVRALAPDALILDARLGTPAGGWDLLDRLKGDPDPAVRAMPVIVCSADTAGLRERAADAARRGYALLAKPFDLDDLLGLLRRGLGLDDEDEGEGEDG